MINRLANPIAQYLLSKFTHFRHQITKICHVSDKITTSYARFVLSESCAQALLEPAKIWVGHRNSPFRHHRRMASEGSRNEEERAVG